MMKTIYDLATEAGILKDVQPYVVEDCLNISNIEKFASLIMDEIVATSCGTFFFLFGMSYFVTVEDLKAFAIYLGEVYYNSSVSIWYLP